jgi:hypothetical protein
MNDWKTWKAQYSECSTAELLTAALALVEQERAGEVEVINPPLAFLVERTDQEIIEAGFDLLASEVPAKRQLGASILKETPGLQYAPHPHSARLVKTLRLLVAQESDLEVLWNLLSAVGWQLLPEGMDILLSQIEHENCGVRWRVANKLLMLCPESREMPKAMAQAFLRLARDPDEDIRWSVFYDMAEHFQYYHCYQDEFVAAAAHAENDPVAKVRKEARRASEALAGRKPEET